MGQRHYARWKRCSALVLPKLMSSFEDFDGEEEDAAPAAHKVGTLHDVEIRTGYGQGRTGKILGTTTAAPDDMCSSARRNRFFEPLNDTTGRPHRVFRKTPPPPTIRGVSTSGVPKQEEEEEEEEEEEDKGLSL